MRITVSHDLSRIAQSLNRLSGRLNGSLEEPLRAIGGILESSTRRRIAETKTAPDGKRWQDVSPATAQAKKWTRRDFGGPRQPLGKHYARGIGKKCDYRLGNGLLGLCAGRHENHAGASFWACLRKIIRTLTI